MPKDPCPNLQTNLESCPCTSDDCPRKGTCCDCIRAHVSSGGLPACARPVAEKMAGK